MGDGGARPTGRPPRAVAGPQHHHRAGRRGRVGARGQRGGGPAGGGRATSGRERGAGWKAWTRSRARQLEASHLYTEQTL